MTQLICKIIGHKEFDPNVLREEPWHDHEFSHRSIVDFKERNCLRCGEDLEAQAA